MASAISGWPTRQGRKLGELFEQERLSQLLGSWLGLLTDDGQRIIGTAKLIFR